MCAASGGSCERGHRCGVRWGTYDKSVMQDKVSLFGVIFPDARRGAERRRGRIDPSRLLGTGAETASQTSRNCDDPLVLEWPSSPKSCQ